MPKYNPPDGKPFMHPDSHYLVVPGEWYETPRGEEEAPQELAKTVDPSTWPSREDLDQQFKAAELKGWAVDQGLQFPGSIKKDELLDLIDQHRSKAPAAADGQ